MGFFFSSHNSAFPCFQCKFRAAHSCSLLVKAFSPRWLLFSSASAAAFVFVSSTLEFPPVLMHETEWLSSMA